MFDLEVAARSYFGDLGLIFHFGSFFSFINCKLLVSGSGVKSLSFVASKVLSPFSAIATSGYYREMFKQHHKTKQND